MNETQILAKSETVLLRDSSPADVDAYLRWQTTGQWRYYDAPWEGVIESLSPEQQKNFRFRFLQSQQEFLPTPRERATIALPDSTPIGWVTRYGIKRFPAVWYIGIDICEDAYLNSGLGTEALRLWTGYLFDGSEIHKVEIHTWSFNPRMARVAEKLGFTLEGTEQELIQWQGEWIHRLRFGMLRQDWEKISR